MPAGPVPGVPSLRGEREVHGRFIRGRRRVHGACYAGCVPEHPGAREDLAGGLRAVVPGTGESGAEVLLPAGLGSCTGLYVAVRGIGGEGAGSHVHMADSVAGTNLMEWCLCRSEGMWRRSQERAVKTVGSAYVGSNPTPATPAKRSLGCGNAVRWAVSFSLRRVSVRVTAGRRMAVCAYIWSERSSVTPGTPRKDILDPRTHPLR